MRKGKLILGFAALMSALATTTYAEPKIEIHGDADADVWYDMSEHKAYNSHDVNLAITGQITENVSATIGITSTAGAPPAGAVGTDERWGTMDFDGAWIDWSTPIEGLALSIGDLVYTFGGFNYYLYKNYGMISPEIFPRGLQASYDMGMLTLTGIAGTSDDAAGSTMLGGIVGVTPMEGATLDFIFMTTSDEDTDMNAGVTGVIPAGPAEIKFDFGYITQGDSTGMNLLIEPSVGFGDASVAASFFMKLTDESIAQDIGEDMFFYIEPGYAFNDMIAAGLPLEYHDTDMDADNDASFWVVPTLYIYPAEGLEWWLWGGAINPLTDDDDAEMALSAGSEIIFSF